MTGKQRRADRRTEQRKTVQAERARYVAALEIIADTCVGVPQVIARAALDGHLVIMQDGTAAVEYRTGGTP